MHFDKIEDYDFDHGLEFNTQTGEYHSLNPHDLGRPLSHVEMDYNLMYQKQTLNGWRIAGSNADLTLNNSDLGKVLAYHKVDYDPVDDPDNVMYDRHIAAGLFNGQYIWIPVQPGAMPFTTLDPCLGFGVAGVSWTNSLAYFVEDKNPAYTVSSSATNVAEGNVVVIAINGTDVDDGTTVGWTMSAYENVTAATAATTQATSGSGSGSGSGGGSGMALSSYNPVLYRMAASDPSEGFNELDIQGGVISGEVVMTGGLASVVIQIKLDTDAEGPELFKFKLAEQDGANNNTNEPFTIVTIIDVYNNPTAATTIATTQSCIDDIVSQINECDDDITSQINECNDDIASVIIDLLTPPSTDSSGSGIGSGVSGSGGGSGVSGSGSGSGVSGSGGGSGVSGSGGGGLTIATTQATSGSGSGIQGDLYYEVETRATTRPVIGIQTLATIREDLEPMTKATTRPPVEY